MIRILCTMALVLTSTLPLSDQARPRVNARRHSAAPSTPSPTLAPYSPSPRGLYQPRMTWYEFLLHELNPHDTDGGAWYRERREALVDASIRNPYFWHSFWASVAVILLLIGLIKSLYDRKKEKRIMGDMMNEVKAHDAQSRRVAHEAIRRYNDHIEMCNRAIEASEAGAATALGGNSPVPSPSAELDAEKQKVSALTSDKLRLETELAQKTALVTDLSLRIDALSKQGGNGHGSDPADVAAPSVAELVRQINSLEQQLYAEREKNKRLKGGL
jgi:hypothetical protein